MRRWRAGLSLGVIAALVVAIWAAVSAGGQRTDSPATSTTTAPSSTVPTTAGAPSSTTSKPTTTVTSRPTSTTIDAEARLEEVRLILQDLWFRWFDAIYSQDDEEAVRQVVATET